MPVRFKRKIRKWGDSLIFSIPPEILDTLTLKKGDEVIIYVDDERMIVEKASKLSRL